MSSNDVCVIVERGDGRFNIYNRDADADADGAYDEKDEGYLIGFARDIKTATAIAESEPTEYGYRIEWFED